MERMVHLRGQDPRLWGHQALSLPLPLTARLDFKGSWRELNAITSVGCRGLLNIWGSRSILGPFAHFWGVWGLR